MGFWLGRELLSYGKKVVRRYPRASVCSRVCMNPNPTSSETDRAEKPAVWTYPEWISHIQAKCSAFISPDKARPRGLGRAYARALLWVSPCLETFVLYSLFLYMDKSPLMIDAEWVKITFSWKWECAFHRNTIVYAIFLFTWAHKRLCNREPCVVGVFLYLSQLSWIKYGTG